MAGPTVASESQVGRWHVPSRVEAGREPVQEAVVPGSWLPAVGSAPCWEGGASQGPGQGLWFSWESQPGPSRGPTWLYRKPSSAGGLWGPGPLVTRLVVGRGEALGHVILDQGSALAWEQCRREALCPGMPGRPRGLPGATGWLCLAASPCVWGARVSRAAGGVLLCARSWCLSRCY